jgi:hypothetical protein
VIGGCPATIDAEPRGIQDLTGEKFEYRSNGSLNWMLRFQVSLGGKTLGHTGQQHPGVFPRTVVAGRIEQLAVGNDPVLLASRKRRMNSTFEVTN